MCPPQDGEFVYEWSLERSAHADQGLQHEFDIECYDPTCVEECASPVQGECAGLVFPGGSSQVPMDTIGTQAERDAEAQRLADLAAAAEEAEQRRAADEAEQEKELNRLWEIIRCEKRPL
jgi:hypothetical protein